MHKRHKDSVFECLFRTAYEMRDHRENIEKNAKKDPASHPQNDPDDCKQSSILGVDNVKIHPQKSGSQKQDEPYHGALPEILPEGFKKVPQDIWFLAPEHFQEHIVQGAYGGAYGNDGNAENQKDDVQDDQVKKPGDKLHNRTIQIK